MEYVVRWEIELEAESKLEAAKKALQMIIDQESTAHAFEVAVNEQLVIAKELELDDEEIYTLVDLDDEHKPEETFGTYEFCSSHGTLTIDAEGNVLNNPDELEDWLTTIKKVDVEELVRYTKLMGLNEVLADGDVMDFGYWDNEGNYQKPEESWRLDIFNNQKLADEICEKLVESSIKWIKQNR
jgi:hypothetical protein